MSKHDTEIDRPL